MHSNHHSWLDAHLPNFFTQLGISFDAHAGIVTAHGDKCYGYKTEWEQGGLHFYHGVAIYLTTHVAPFSREVRTTESGWVDPAKWVLAHKDRFLPFLPSAGQA